MVKLMEALALSGSGVDTNIAFGEAVPRFVRLKRVAITVFVAAWIVLALGYAHLYTGQQEIREHQLEAQLARAEILDHLRVIRESVGQQGANALR